MGVSPPLKSPFLCMCDNVLRRSSVPGHEPWLHCRSTQDASGPLFRDATEPSQCGAVPRSHKRMCDHVDAQHHVMRPGRRGHRIHSILFVFTPPSLSRVLCTLFGNTPPSLPCSLSCTRALLPWVRYPSSCLHSDFQQDAGGQDALPQGPSVGIGGGCVGHSHGHRRCESPIVFGWNEATTRSREAGHEVQRNNCILHLRCGQPDQGVGHKDDATSACILLVQPGQESRNQPERAAGCRLWPKSPG
jgi:hypothetical protein